jgi:single-stranded-DNA-specific exonuclease
MSLVSVTGKKWTVKNTNQEEVNFLKDNFFLDDITSMLISNRNIKREKVQQFLNPLIKDIIPNPNILKDMEKSVQRTIQAFKQKEKIGIFGDYDVDGASSTAMLGNYFNETKNKFEIYIPDRKKEGYGPSINGLDQLIKSDVKLIFTVDCGTLSYKPLEFAKSKKIDLIVLDHHQSEIKLPNAYSIVNPNRIDDNSNLNYLCAAGVCFMFLVALNRSLRKINWFESNNIKEPNLIEFLDLVSLGTVCDVVPLVELNRAIVKQGLKILKNKKNLGIKTLLDICKIESLPTPYHLGYVIGPRINAGGRVGKCSHGANLLLSQNPRDSYKIASELDNYNKERQFLEQDLINLVLNKLDNEINDPAIILYDEGWHQGIIGIVAARIKDKFNKPVIIISVENNIGKASARSILGFDIGAAIISAVDMKILQKGGGHKMAGGFTIDMNKIDDLKKFIFKKIKSTNKNYELKNIIVDSEISPSSLNIDFFEKINLLSPFGSGNIEPRFIIKNLKILNSRIVGEKHIKSILIGRDGSTIQTIAFNVEDNGLGPYLMKSNKKPIHIAGKLSLNEWKGKKNVEFIIDDISVNKNDDNTVPSSIG